MQFAVELQVFDSFAAVGLERRPKIMQVQAAKAGHEPIRSATRKLPCQPGIVPFEPPAANDVITLADLRDECRDFGGIVLKVSVHRNDDFALGEIEAGFQARSLSEIFS